MRSPLASKLLLGVLCVVGSVVVIWVALMFVEPMDVHDNAKVFLNGKEIAVVIADAKARQEKGLSGYKKLEPNEGMLFVFSTPGAYGFWMKDMLFPIDIIWFDKDYRVVDLWEHATPESYPKVYIPQKEAKYVLEVVSGFSSAHAVKYGDLLELNF